MTGDLYINDKDAYTNWGIGLESGALATLMTPPGMKDYINNSSRDEHGQRIINVSPKKDSRELTLQLYLLADSVNQFITRYNSFCTELAKGAIDIKTRYQSGVVYHCYYVSCNQYSQFFGGIAKFTLKLLENNPNNRS